LRRPCRLNLVKKPESTDAMALWPALLVVAASNGPAG
jgi:hypothetical protein